MNFQNGLVIQPYVREHCPLAEKKPRAITNLATVSGLSNHSVVLKLY